MMKIVVTDGYAENPGDLSWEPLRAFGELTVYDRVAPDDEEEMLRRIGDADIAVTNKGVVSKKVIDACPNLKLIAVQATGYNVIDIAYAKEKGIPVCNVPVYGTRSVSQFAIALLLEVCHHMAEQPGLVLLGLSPHRAGRQDLWSAWLRQHRHPYRRDCQGAGDAGHCL